MTSLALYREGKLREAIVALGEELRADPLDSRRRTFLFELLLFAGDYDRAEKQLDLLSGANPDAAAGSLLYRSALHAERTRQEMFASGQTPHLEEGVEFYGGVCDGTPFTSMRDADPRIGPNLEVFVAGSYTWIPLRYVRALEMQPPAKLRDLVWIPARLQTSADFPMQELGEVLLPALCPLSFRHSEDAVRLGRESAWEPDATQGEIPFGAKTFLIDEEERPLVDLRHVEWLVPAKEPQNASA